MDEARGEDYLPLIQRRTSAASGTLMVGILKVLVEYEGNLQSDTQVSGRDLDIGDRHTPRVSCSTEDT